MRALLTRVLLAYGHPVSPFWAKVKAYLPVALVLGAVALGALAAGAPMGGWGGR